MRRAALSFLVLCLAFSLSALASTPRADSGISRPWDDPEEMRPDMVTADLNCVILEVKPGNILTVKDEESGNVHDVEILAKIPVRAQDKKQFAGRKKLEFKDFEIGQRIKVTVRPEVEEIVRIVVLKDQKEDKGQKEGS